MLYRLSAHEKLADIAHAHGTTTNAICAANPHKHAVELPGVGAVFAEMRAGEEIVVPGVGEGLRQFSSPDVVATVALSPCEPVELRPRKGVVVSLGELKLQPGLIIDHSFWQAQKLVSGLWDAVVAPGHVITLYLPSGFDVVTSQFAGTFLIPEGGSLLGLATYACAGTGSSCPPGFHAFAGKCVKTVKGFGLPGAGGGTKSGRG